MNIEGIDHIQLAMPAGEEAKARRFYSDLLGIPEVPKPDPFGNRLELMEQVKRDEH